MVRPCLEDNCHTAVGILADLASGLAAGAQAGSLTGLDFELLDVGLDMRPGDSGVDTEEPPYSARVTDLEWADRLPSENIPSAADTVHRKILLLYQIAVVVDNHLSQNCVPCQGYLHRYARTATIHDEDGRRHVAQERGDLVEYLRISSAAVGR